MGWCKKGSFGVTAKGKSVGKIKDHRREKVAW